MNNLKWLDFIQGINTMMITNEREFEIFKNFMDDIGLGKFLRDEREFSDWQHLSILNNNDPNCIIFEIQPGKGMTFGYTPKSSMEWYGVEPLKVDVLDSFYEKSKLANIIKEASEQADYCCDAFSGVNSFEGLNLLCESDLVKLNNILNPNSSPKEIQKESEVEL